MGSLLPPDAGDLASGSPAWAGVPPLLWGFLNENLQLQGLSSRRLRDCPLSPGHPAWVPWPLLALLLARI